MEKVLKCLVYSEEILSRRTRRYSNSASIWLTSVYRNLSIISKDYLYEEKKSSNTQYIVYRKFNFQIFKLHFNQEWKEKANKEAAIYLV